ncbi:hypothetical protein C6341_g16002 [Phytophthora cactorum]|nr:hypothetical protein C6341_g16002 [Phytophthora cactorum]
MEKFREMRPERRVASKWSYAKHENKQHAHVRYAGPEANFRIGDCLDFTILEYRLKNITMTSKVTTTDPELYMQTDTTEH